MSLILRGHVTAVVDAGQGDKQYGVVALQTTTTDNMGIPMVETIKLMVFGRDYKQGLQNAYRQLQGVEVFAPVRVAGDDRGDGVRYFLAGLPAQLIDKPVEKPAVVRPAAQA